MSLQVNKMNIKSLPQISRTSTCTPLPPRTGYAQKDYALFVKALSISAVVQYLGAIHQLIVLLFTYRGA